MRSDLSFAFPILCSLTILMLSCGYYTSFCSLKLYSLGFADTTIGYIGAFFYLGMFFTPIYSNSILRRFSLKRLFIYCVLGNSIATLLQILSNDWSLWATTRFLNGAFAGLYYVVIESWLLFATPLSFRSRIISIYLIALYVGQGISQYAIVIMDIHSNAPFYYSALISLFSAIPMIYGKEPTFVVAHSEASSWMNIIKKAPVGIYTCLISGIILGAFYVLLPVYVAEIARSESEVSFLLSTTILGGVLLQWPVGKLSDMWSQKHVYIAVCLLLILSSVLLSVIPLSSIGLTAFLLLIFGAASFVIYQIALSYTCSLFTAHSIISISAIMVIIWGIGSVMGPPIVSNLMQYFGKEALFEFNALLTIPLLFAFMVAKMPKQAKKEG